MAKDNESNGAGTKAKKSPQNEKSTGGNMPLFYKSPEPLDAKKHAASSLKKNFGFGFTQDVNAVPVNMIEMTQVLHYYPIAFSPDDNATPVAIIGLRDNENLFLGPDGKTWIDNAYIPAYIRRYPFIFSEMPDSDQLTLCIDNTAEIVDDKGQQKFFDEDGKPSQLSQSALEFCKSYHAASQQTAEFGKALADSGILIEQEAQVNVAGNRRINFSGFRIIDEKKLAELDDKTFATFKEKGWLPFIYAHLFSGAQWNRLSRLLNQRLEKEAA